MPIFKPTYNLSTIDYTLPSVFLAGSIELNKAENWQTFCEQELHKTFNVFNPRRESWNTSWKQDMNNKYFREQVEWELEALELAQTIIMYFAPGTKSPISLLEFGMYAKSGKMVVVCSDNFWRKGNIDIVCNKYNIQQFNNLSETVKHLKT